MPLTRRRLLQSGAALLASCAKPGGEPVPAPGRTPAPSRSSEPDPWDAPGELDEVAFDRGVQVGDATDSAALVSVRTSEPALTLVLMRAVADSWVEAFRTELSPQDGGAQLDLDGLSADTAYTVCLYAGERRSVATRFRTAPAAGNSRVVTFGATSCFGGNKPWPSLSFAAAERLDFFVLLGDTVYADGADSIAEYRDFWDEALATGGLRDVCASTSLVATWDDHEVGNDWDPVEDEALAVTALQAFREAIPMAGDSLWRSLRWGDTLELFVLDCRGERRDGVYISPAQMEWLKAGLAASPATFKIVATSVPVTDFTGTALGDYFSDQRWQGYPAQRAEILDATADIPGILWLAGDFHFGLLARVDPGSDVMEVLAGPAGSFLNPIVETLDDADRFPVAFGKFNHVRFEADPGMGTIALAWIGDDGAAIAQRTLTIGV